MILSSMLLLSVSIVASSVKRLNFLFSSFSGIVLNIAYIIYNVFPCIVLFYLKNLILETVSVSFYSSISLNEIKIMQEENYKLPTIFLLPKYDIPVMNYNVFIPFLNASRI